MARDIGHVIDENKRLRGAVLWFWEDMREVDRMYLRMDHPELVALCESLESVPPHKVEPVRASDDDRAVES